MNNKFSKNIIGTITGIIGLLLVSVNALAAPGGNGGKPVDVSGSVDIPANSVKPGSCSFDVRWTLNGKAKEIQLSNNRVIFTSPQLTVQVENLSAPEKSVNLSVTGAFHQTIQNNGNVVTVITGRNLVTDPDAGMVLAIGTFRYVFDASGKLIEPLNGQGQLINVCDLIS